MATNHVLWLSNKEQLAYVLTCLCVLVLLLLTDGGFCFLPAPDISSQTARYQPLRQLLPAHGRVDFVSNVTDKGDFKRILFVARYNLAPIVLEGNAGNSLIVGDFQGAPDLVAFARQHRLVIIKDYHNGLALFSREQPP